MVLSSHKESHPATVQNYFYAIIALTVLLYLLGGLGIFVVYSNNAIASVQEQIPFYIELSDSASDAEIFKLQQQLEKSDFAKAGTVKLIPKEEAKNNLIKEINLKEEDIMLFGENLLPNSIAFNLNSDYIGQYKKIVSELKANKAVADVYHTEELTKTYASNLQRISLITVLFVIFFIFVAVTLIKNTLKLSILANKQTIKVLQISGAGTDYIARPYIQRSLLNGILSGFIATIALIITILILQMQMKGFGLESFGDWASFAGIFIGIMGVGVLTFWGSAQHSIRKYFSMPVEDWS